ncbi:MAG: iron-sulfur cluster assembly protein [Leptothrix ochracea]|uniref:iron-sulfur cluster assembly protein n=1 Tax=Leptothrix ochracea TaxID=735331 RepID=UPI0034E2A956
MHHCNPASSAKVIPIQTTCASSPKDARDDQGWIHHPEASIQELLTLLRSVRDPVVGEDIVSLGCIRSLTRGDGEVDVLLRVSTHCHRGLLITEAVFETLRYAFPDTDIYVRSLRT